MFLHEFTALFLCAGLRETGNGSVVGYGIMNVFDTGNYKNRIKCERKGLPRLMEEITMAREPGAGSREPGAGSREPGAIHSIIK